MWLSGSKQLGHHWEPNKAKQVYICTIKNWCCRRRSLVVSYCHREHTRQTVRTACVGCSSFDAVSITGKPVGDFGKVALLHQVLGEIQNADPCRVYRRLAVLREVSGRGSLQLASSSGIQGIGWLNGCTTSSTSLVLWKSGTHSPEQQFQDPIVVCDWEKSSRAGPVVCISLLISTYSCIYIYSASTLP